MGTVLLALGVAGCDEKPSPIPDDDVTVFVGAPRQPVALGQSFPLRVERSWAKTHAPSDFDEAALAPLTLRLLTNQRRQNATHVEETRRYLAYAFQPGEARVPEVAFTASPTNGGETATARSAAFSLRITSALPRGVASAPELPGGPLAEPFPWRGAALLIAGCLGAAAFVVWKRRRAPEPPPAPVSAEPKAPPPWLVARERLETLRERAANPTADDDAALCDGIASVMREYALFWGLDAPEKTTEELVESKVLWNYLKGRERDRFLSILSRCDIVRFARRPLDTAGRADLLDDATKIVESTAVPALEDLYGPHAPTGDAT